MAEICRVGRDEKVEEGASEANVGTGSCDWDVGILGYCFSCCRFGE